MKTESTETQEKKPETLEEATMSVLNEASSWKDTGFGSSVWLGKERAKKIAQSREETGSDGPLKTELSKAADIIHKLYSKRRAELISMTKQLHDAALGNEMDRRLLNDKEKNPDGYTMWDIVKEGSGIAALDVIYKHLVNNLTAFNRLLTKDDRELRGELDYGAIGKGFGSKGVGET